MQAKSICLLASQIAKGGTGMVALAGQMLTLVLEELKLTRDLKMNRVTQSVVVQAGTNGPFSLEADYLRTYDMFYPLATPQGMTQFLSPITMEQYDAEFKATQTADYPYEFATDLSTQAQGATGATGVTGVSITYPGLNYASLPSIVYSGGVGSGASAAAHMGLASASLTVLGAGYVVGDIITALGGTFTRPMKFQVTSIGGGGSVSGILTLDAGDYSILPANPISTSSSGVGAGFAFNANLWFLTSIVVTAPGIYTSAPTAATSGGTPTIPGTLAVTLGSISSGAGQFFIYPQSNAQLTITHRYMRNQPDIPTPETSTTVPWFPHTLYLVHRTAGLLMGITGDDRETTFLKESEAMLAPYLIMEGDEQGTVRSVKLDPRRFRNGGAARPTKTQPY